MLVVVAMFCICTDLLAIIGGGGKYPLVWLAERFGMCN